MYQKRVFCDNCREIIQGSQGVLPHSELLKLNNQGHVHKTVYRCRHCGFVWEYRVDNLRPGWQVG